MGMLWWRLNEAGVLHRGDVKPWSKRWSQNDVRRGTEAGKNRSDPRF